MKPVYPFHDGAIPGFHTSPNGLMSSSTSANDSISSEAAVAMAAVMGLRQQHLNAAVANQHHSESDLSNFNLRAGKQSKHKIKSYLHFSSYF